MFRQAARESSDLSQRGKEATWTTESAVNAVVIKVMYLMTRPALVQNLLLKFGDWS